MDERDFDEILYETGAARRRRDNERAEYGNALSRVLDTSDGCVVMARVLKTLRFAQNESAGTFEAGLHNAGLELARDMMNVNPLAAQNILRLFFNQ